jgi:hypothetical protein
MHGSARMVQTLCLVAFLSALWVLAGCTSHRAVGQLPSQEWAEFRAHRKLMSPGQIRACFAKSTPEARRVSRRDWQRPTVCGTRPSGS